jgi:hypothetical integral membrane protein (TIGR02206 family)
VGQPFVAFGAGHVGALLTTALVAAGLVGLARRRAALARRICIAFAALVGGASVAFVVLDAVSGRGWRELAPLHLCDVAVPLAVVALVTRAPLAFELVWLWGTTGSLAAMLTPDVARGFPDYRFVLFFVQHGGVVAAAALLAFGLGLRLRPGAPWRAWLWLNVYGALVAVVDYAGDANFMYLRHKPGVPTPLDWLGPWPLYLVVADALALALFLLVGLPVRASASPAAQGPASCARRARRDNPQPPLGP